MARKIIAQDGESITPSDSDIFAKFGSLYIGTGGDVALTTELGTNLTFVNVPDGTFLPVVAKAVLSTNTTASNIIVMY